jgi:lysophospholipase L1-like esterase
MSKFLFMGDSLTAGNLGFSFLKLLQDSSVLMEHTLMNGGEDGYTLEGLRLKLEAFLTRNKLPDVLILEGGANDVLLPRMQSQGPEWDPFIRKLKRHGSVPAGDKASFRNTLRTILSAAFDSMIPRVMICTIPCLGEDLSSGLNLKREEYNNIIREACLEYEQALFDCSCIDLAQRFEETLLPFQPGSPYLFKDPEALQHDALRILSEGENTLCSERKLQLTIDGAHLNSKGAELMARCFLEAFHREGLISFIP